MEEIITMLRGHAIQPSAQRVAVASYVLSTDSHPSADQVWARVRTTFPAVSRATIYNTLNLFVEKGLLKQLAIAEGRVVFDPRVERHHHLLDEETGEIHDLPWDAVDIRGEPQIDGFDVTEYQVVLKGRRT